MYNYTYARLIFASQKEEENLANRACERWGKFLMGRNPWSRCVWKIQIGSEQLNPIPSPVMHQHWNGYFCLLQGEGDLQIFHLSKWTFTPLLVGKPLLCGNVLGFVKPLMGLHCRIGSRKGGKIWPYLMLPLPSNLPPSWPNGHFSSFHPPTPATLPPSAVVLEHMYCTCSGMS